MWRGFRPNGQGLESQTPGAACGDPPVKDTRNAVSGTVPASRACWAFAFAAPLVFLAAACLASHFSFNRWDNFEYFTPVISEAHGQWLDGRVPYWNPRQHLGEPLLANAMPGVLYFPYTLAVLFVRLLGLRMEALPLIIVVMHLPFLSAGWFALLRRMGMRPALAGAAAASACSGGFLWVMASVWIFMVAVGTWLPWMLWGAAAAMDEPHRVRGGLVLSVSLAALACLGHPQMLVYVWCFLVLWAPLHAWWSLGRARSATRLAFPLAAGVLLSLPALLPTMEIVPYTVRGGALPLAECLSRSAAPASLLGLLLPLYGIQSACMPIGISLLLHQGAWLVPALVLGAGAAWALRKERAAQAEAAGPSSIAKLRGAFLAALAAGVLFLLLAMGKYTGVYRLTYGLPVWSSFRWPFKLLMNANVGLLLAAALGLELVARVGPALRWRWAAGLISVVAAGGLLLIVAPPPHLAVPVTLLCLLAGLAAMALVPWADRRRVRWALAGLIALEALTCAVLSHCIELKTYREAYGTCGPEQMGLTPGYRVLPVSAMDMSAPGAPTYMQAFGLFESATVNGYDGATGHTTPLAPSWYQTVLPSSVHGVPDPDAAKMLLGSDMLRSLNVRYVIVSKNHPADLAAVERSGRYRLHRTLERTLVYEDEGAFPRAYFASLVSSLSDSDLRAFGADLILGGAPPRAAFVAGGDMQGAVPEGCVLSADWQLSRVRIEVEAPQGGFLVVSQCYFPQWHAYVDGEEKKVWRVNGTLQGVEVPAGAKDVVLEYRSFGLRAGLWGAFAGLVLLAGRITLRRWRGTSSVDAPPAQAESAL